MNIYKILEVLVIIYFIFFNVSCNKNIIGSKEDINNSNDECGIIAFVSTRNGGDHDIFIMDSDGSDLTALTDNNFSDFSPDWSPNGAKMVFDSMRNGNRDIFIMDNNGDNVICLTTDCLVEDLYPDWSPDGEKILFTSGREGNWQIYTINIETRDIQRLTNSQSDDFGGRWSPDGKKILFTSNRDGNLEIYCLDIIQNITSRLTNNPGMDVCAQWSPNGLKIVYVSSGNGEDIWIMDSNGSNKEPLITTNSNEFVPCWSPDGQYISFQTSYDGNDDEIAIFNLESEEITRLTFSQGIDTYPAWK